jgi:hypothetical protein
VLAVAVPLAGCGKDESCSVTETPSPPETQGFRGDIPALFWSDVPNATSYNVYIKAVENCADFDPKVAVTTSDRKYANVRSPFDVTSFNQCGVCYYYGVTALNGECESPLRTPGGFGSVPCP